MSLPGAYIPRDLEPTLHRAASEFRVVTLTGPRQSGKTTLLRQCFPEKRYVSLEDPDTRDFALSDPRGFLGEVSASSAGVVLDEVQRTPELFSYIQGIVDEANQPGQFVLSGSQNFNLLEQVSQSLAGRAAVLYLLPFSLAEIQRAGRHSSDSLPATLFRGAYPRLFGPTVDLRQWYQSYLETYVERDVRQLLNVADLDKFRTFLRMCAFRTAQLVNLSSLALDCGLTQNTVKSWLSVLETSFIVKRVSPFFRNLGKRLVKTPKLYFLDTGLLCTLIGIHDGASVALHPQRGALFETWVLAELTKAAYNRGERPAIYFWRDRSGHEVDFILESGQVLRAVEVKSGATLTAEHFKELEFFVRQARGVDVEPNLVYGGDANQERAGVRITAWRHLASRWQPISSD